MIHAAAGGTGALLVQIARMRGATVIGTVGSAEKARIAKRAGANKVINYITHEFEAEVRKITKGAGVDVVYDSVGKDTFEQSLNCLNPRGMMVLFGAASGAVPPFNAANLESKGLAATSPGPHCSLYIAKREDLLKKIRDLTRWIAAGTAQGQGRCRVRLADAAQAHNTCPGRNTKGKVVICPVIAKIGPAIGPNS